MALNFINKKKETQKIGKVLEILQSELSFELWMMIVLIFVCSSLCECNVGDEERILLWPNSQLLGPWLR